MVGQENSDARRRDGGDRGQVEPSIQEAFEAEAIIRGPPEAQKQRQDLAEEARDDGPGHYDACAGGESCAQRRQSESLREGACPSDQGRLTYESAEAWLTRQAK